MSAVRAPRPVREDRILRVLLLELRELRALVETLAEHQGMEVPDVYLESDEIDEAEE